MQTSGAYSAGVVTISGTTTINGGSVTTAGYEADEVDALFSGGNTKLIGTILTANAATPRSGLDD